MSEPLDGGGRLVRLASGSLAIEGRPDVARGSVVASALWYRYGDAYRRGRYRITRRVVADTDLWHVIRTDPEVRS